jgi:hypothetical protein
LTSEFRRRRLRVRRERDGNQSRERPQWVDRI